MGGWSKLILTSVELNIFTGFLSKTVVQLWSQACPAKNRDPYARWFKPRYFVADGGKELIGRCVVAEDTMDSPLVTKFRPAEFWLEVGCCGRFMLPISWKWWGATLSIFRLIEVGADTTSFCNNGSLISLTVFYLNLSCHLWLICWGPCNVQCILPSDFGKFHLICGLLSDVCTIFCCGDDSMRCHETISKWWLVHLHRDLVQSMGLYFCFCHLILNFYLETFSGTFIQCFP